MSQVALFIGWDWLFTVLRAHQLLVRVKRAFHRTTESRHRLYEHPNLIKEVVANITYLPTYSGDTYLCLVTNAYSRMIIGYYLAGNLKTATVKQTFNNTHQRKGELIHYSDRGVQYCYHQYHARYSMTDSYDYYQNTLAGRMSGILKQECLIHKTCMLKEASIDYRLL